MTLAGTRPILQEELRQYELHHRARIAIKPGITGMWQVSGRSDITDFEEVVRLDTEYISNWNFGLDIKILFKTVITVLKIVQPRLGLKLQQRKIHWWSCNIVDFLWQIIWRSRMRNISAFLIILLEIKLQIL